MKFRLPTLAAITLAAVLPHPVSAASLYWSGNGLVDPFAWTDVTNWSTNPTSDTPNPLAVPGAADTAIFNTTSAFTPTGEDISLDADQSVLGIQVLSGNGAFIEGDGIGTLTVGTGGISVASTGNLSLASDVILGTGGITVATGGTASLQDNAILNGNQTWSGDQSVNNPAANLTFTNITGTGNLVLSGNFNPSIQTGTASLNGSITIAGSTEWYSAFLNGASGGVVTAMGTLGLHADPITGVFELDHALVLSGGNTNMYTNGAPVVLAGPVSGQLSIVNFVTTNSLTLSGTANNALNLTTPANVVTYLAKTSSSNVHAVGTNLAVSNASTIMITGTGGDQIKDSIDVTMNSGSTFDLNGHNEAVDGLIGAGGVITDSAASTSSTITLGAANGSNTFAGIIQNGAGTLNLRKTGSGTLTLTGGNTYTGATTVNQGTLLLDYNNTTAASILNPASSLVLGGGTFKVNGNNAIATSQIVNGVTLNAGASNLSVVANNNMAAVLNVGTITHNAGSALNFTLPSGTQSATNGILTTSANTGTTILGGWATVNGTDWAVSSGGNINPLGTYVADTWAAGNDTNVTTSSSPTSGSTTNSLRFGSGGANTLTLAGTNVVATGGILVAPAVGNNASSVTGGALTSGTGELYIQQYNTANSLTVSSAVTDNGVTPTSLTKAGTGALNLSGVNTFSGSFNVNNGVVNLTGANSAMSAVNVNGGGTLNISGASALTTAAPVNISNGGTVNVASSGTLGNGSNAVTLSGGSTLNFNNGGTVALPTVASAYQSSSDWRNTPLNLATNTSTGMGTPFSYQVGANGGGAAQPDFILIDLGSDMALGQIQANIANSYRNLQVFTAPSSVGSFSSLFTANGNSMTSPSVLNLGLFTPDSADFNTGGIDAPTGASNIALTGVTGEYLAIYITARVGNGYGLDINNLVLNSIAGPVTQSIGSLSGVSTTSTVNLNTNLTLSVGSNNTSTAYAGIINGGGALSKTGTGVLTLTNANTYLGSTSILQGTVKAMNTSGSATGSGAVLINGGSLTGTGIVTGPVTLTSGSISAGDVGVGTLTLGSLTWNGGSSQLAFNLDLADNLSTVLTINGAFTEGTAGAYDIDFGGTGAGGFTYTLINFGSTNFNVNDIHVSGLASGVTGTLALNGTNLTISTVSVPEPGTLPLLGLALGGFIVFQLRRARRA